MIFGLAAAVLAATTPARSPWCGSHHGAARSAPDWAALALRLRPAALRPGRCDQTDEVAPPEPLHRWALVWLGLVVAIVAWELYCYLDTPRPAHPTLSGLLDMLDARPIGKFVAYSLWLALGWVLIIQ